MEMVKKACEKLTCYDVVGKIIATKRRRTLREAFKFVLPEEKEKSPEGVHLKNFNKHA